jgi:hypothetical protein
MTLRRLASVVAIAWLGLTAPADAAPLSPRAGALAIGDPTGITDAIGDGLKGLAGVLVGGFNWTTDVAGKFIINTLGGLVDLLIPDSWADQGLSIMQWVVAVPNYAARLAGPDGAHSYAFAGINDLRDLFVWLGIALLPLSLTYASTRAIFGLGDHVALPVVRTLAIGAVLISYTWLWGQAAAISNQLTKAVLGVQTVSDGLNKMFAFIVGGGALVGGLPLVGLLVTGGAGVALLAMIFVKVLMILVGAIVYVTGPVMIGVAPTERGAAAARAWLTLATGLFVLPILWATVFAIAALLMNDSGGASALIGTTSDLGRILGGLILGLAAIAGFWLNLKLTKFAAAILGGQVAGMLALATSGGHGASSAAGTRVSAGSAREALSSFAHRVGGAARGAAAPLAGSGRVGAMLTNAGAGAGALARGGLLGAGAGIARRGGAAAAGSPIGQTLGATKAGALATRMARGGRAGWNSPSSTVRTPKPPPAADSARSPDRPPAAKAPGPQAGRGAAAASPASPAGVGERGERGSAPPSRRGRGPGAATADPRAELPPRTPTGSPAPGAPQPPAPGRRSRIPRPRRRKDR